MPYCRCCKPYFLLHLVICPIVDAASLIFCCIFLSSDSNQIPRVSRPGVPRQGYADRGYPDWGYSDWGYQGLHRAGVLRLGTQSILRILRPNLPRLRGTQTKGLPTLRSAQTRPRGIKTEEYPHSYGPQIRGTQTYTEATKAYTGQGH